VPVRRGGRLTRLIIRLAATTLASGALVAAAALPATAPGHDDHRDQQRSSVVLGSIQYDSPGHDDRSRRSLNAEWVDVTNTGRRAVNLDGWTLSDRAGGGQSPLKE
jgi:hypothetical protein